jgi:hypothetical protein
MPIEKLSYVFQILHHVIGVGDGTDGRTATWGERHFTVTGSMRRMLVAKVQKQARPLASGAQKEWVNSRLQFFLLTNWVFFSDLDQVNKLKKELSEEDNDDEWRIFVLPCLRFTQNFLVFCLVTFTPTSLWIFFNAKKFTIASVSRSQLAIRSQFL